MFCKNCGTMIREGMLFCPKCGTSVTATPAPAAEPSVAPAAEPKTEEIKAEAPHAPAVPAEEVQAPQAEEIPAAEVPSAAEPQPAVAPPMTPPAWGWDAPPMMPPVPPKKQRVYHKTSAGVKALTGVLVFVMVLFGLLSVTIATVRIGLTTNSVQASYQDGRLSDLVIDDEGEEMTLAEWIKETAVDDLNGQTIAIDIRRVEDFLNESYLNNFIEDALQDGVRFLLEGKKPRTLTYESIRSFYTRINADYKRNTGYAFSTVEQEELFDRIRDGDLCFLTIGDNDNSFYHEYGFQANLIPTLLSPWMMLLFIAIWLTALILILVINRSNLPAGFGCVGWTLVVFGGVFVLAAVAGLIVSQVKWIFFFSSMIKYLSLGLGIVNLCLLAVGICFLLVKRALKANAVMAEES